MVQSEEIDETRRKLNLFGLIGGILTIFLPFLGTWWQLILGTEAITISISPFEVEMGIFGEDITEEVMFSPLMWWFLLGLKLGVMYLGVLLLIGSILSASKHRAIAEEFIRFSAKKLLWLVIAFVGALFIIILLVNMPSSMFNFPIGDLQLHGNLPYLMGSGNINVELGVFHFSCPVYMSFTKTFMIAILAASLGIASWIYHKLS
ncbi:MAG: hypothetical protein ACXQTS_03315 [Candidatus Methanospirareceae archaeon]